MNKVHALIKQEIIAALSHVEAEDGLYLENLQAVSEEEDREPVSGSQEDILEVLRDLIQQGEITIDETGPKVIFHLCQK